MTSNVMLDAASIRRALNIRDLTDPSRGPHGMQLLVKEIEQGLNQLWGVPLVTHRANPVVLVEDNYDRLRYAPAAVARDARYTRYLSPALVLRTHMSAMIPPLLESLSNEGSADVVLSCPGIVYRRDAIDRMHTGEPHQLDLWRIRSEGPSLGVSDLEEMIGAVVDAALPGYRYRTLPAEHPYTLEGREIEIRRGSEWLEIGECGLAHPEVLSNRDRSRQSTGLAMGLGLDRMLMVRKGMEDIRLLRATDRRITSQMLDLAPYKPVSRMPAIRRDISIAVSGDVDAERLGDCVRSVLGPDASSVEAVEVRSATRGRDLPAVVRERLGMGLEQWNVLLRIVLRDLERTLTAQEANRLRDMIYAALHQGSVHQWASDRPDL
jgi:phenylalanyl-tRNA synthetase alpha chain